MVAGLSGAIIAAGHGVRLRAASGGLPKPLVEVGGETLLVRQSRVLAKLGASPVHAIINSETAEMIRARGFLMPSDLRTCVRDTANSMESLLALGESLAPGRFLMTTVDAVLAAAELTRFLDHALKLTDPAAASPLDGILGVVKWRGDRHPLFAELATDGTIRRLGGPETQLVTAGLYLFSTRIFAFGDRARSLGLNALRQYLALLIGEGMQIAGMELTEVVDIDEAADLDAARALVANQAERR
jgi:NDP-sugar pyrophosphorylase family protein